MKRNRILILLVLCILMLSGLAACQSQSGVQGGAASPQAAVEALYRAQQARDADALLACYPPQVRRLYSRAGRGEKGIQKVGGRRQPIPSLSMCFIPTKKPMR